MHKFSPFSSFNKIPYKKKLSVKTRSCGFTDTYVRDYFLDGSSDLLIALLPSDLMLTTRLQEVTAPLQFL